MKNVIAPKRKERRNTIAEICRDARIYVGLTQKEVAKECCVSVTAVNDFENGRNEWATILWWYLHNTDASNKISLIN